MSFKENVYTATMRSETKTSHRKDRKKMKDKKMMAYTILRMSLAFCGMAFVIADIVTENGENRYLPIGMLFIALANIYSKKGYCLIGKKDGMCR